MPPDSKISRKCPLKLMTLLYSSSVTNARFDLARPARALGDPQVIRK